MNDTSRPLPNGWLVVGLLWLVACLNYLDRVVITAMRGSLTEAIPMTDAQFGLLMSVFAWVYGILSPFAGFLADRLNRSRVIVVSLLVWSVVTWLTGHAKTFEQLLFARALMGISEAAYIPAALALIADYHRGRTRSLATGIHMTGINVGSGLGGIGGYLADGYGWSFSFTLFGMIGIAYTVVLWIWLRDSPPEEKETQGATATHAGKVNLFKALASLFRQPSFLILLTSWGLLGLTGWGIMQWMPTHFQIHFNLSQGGGGMRATGYQHAATLVGLLIGGLWADKWTRTNTRARILVPAIGLCIAAPGLFLLSQTSVLWIAIAGLMIYGLARSFTDANMMPILCLISDPRYRATGYGVLNFFSCVIGGSAPFLGGYLRDAGVGLDKLFVGAAVNMLLCAALLYVVRPTAAAVSEKAI